MRSSSRDHIANPGTLDETSPSPSSRSFFSRFSLPLRSRATRNFTDFHIRPADPHRKYSAGDRVQGAVVLTVLKPVRITHLTVVLHGYVRVYKSANGAGNEPPVNPAEIASQGGSSFKYLGNGFASLFEDEQVLSADGRLDAGRYEFNFDLMFPSKGLPSSIDFERGTISYMITATLTRPTTIAPTTSCERKIYLLEKLDIGPLTAPRPRTIYLEPIPKRSRRKKQALASVERGPASSQELPDVASITSENDSVRAHDTSFDGSSVRVIGEDVNQDGVIHPMSPAQSDHHSEISGDSSAPTTDSTGPSRGSDNNAPKRNSTPGTVQTSALPAVTLRGSAMEDRTITATIELLKGGCLPGDTISVRISVQHIKRIKSMHGVIVTLYRQGRIDSSPPLSLLKGHVSPEEVKKLEKEEYYPKSRTGLGGLSLSSVGSCSVFRKDLSQAFNPLIIDPVTLTANVTASVRVPEDAFPTIKGIPGDMISFKYQLEVIVDLGGKLASQLQSGQSGRTGGTPAAVPLTVNPYEGSATSMAWGGRPIDTGPLRREKGVVSVSFEVVVGTDDASRTRGKGVMRNPSSVFTRQIEEPAPHGEYGHEKGAVPEAYGHGVPYDTPGYEQEFPNFFPPAQPRAPEQPTPIYVPPPQIPEEREFTEKERIRQAEQRLLPSQPSQPPAAGPLAASAPADLDGSNIYSADDDEPVAGPSSAAPPSLMPAGSELNDQASPSAPTLDDLAVTSAVDDKQELERQRLLAEASAPPDCPEDYEAGGPSTPSPSALGTAAPSAPPTNFEPSAPALAEEEDHYGPQYAYQDPGPSHTGQQVVGEELPKYER